MFLRSTIRRSTLLDIINYDSSSKHEIVSFFF